MMILWDWKRCGRCDGTWCVRDQFGALVTCSCEGGRQRMYRNLFWPHLPPTDAGKERTVTLERGEERLTLTGKIGEGINADGLDRGHLDIFLRGDPFSVKVDGEAVPGRYRASGWSVCNARPEIERPSLLEIEAVRVEWGEAR